MEYIGIISAEVSLIILILYYLMLLDLFHQLGMSDYKEGLKK